MFKRYVEAGLMRASSATVSNLAGIIAQQASNANRARGTSLNCTSSTMLARGDATGDNLFLMHWSDRRCVRLDRRTAA